MSTNNYYNYGTINNDHSKHVTINSNGANVTDIVRSFFAEDVEPVQEEKPVHSNVLPFLVPEKLAALGTYSVDEFDAMYHDAVKGGAPKLAKFIKHYKELEVFDTKGYNKKETFEVLKAYFGAELDFGYPNFAAYY